MRASRSRDRSHAPLARRHWFDADCDAEDPFRAAHMAACGTLGSVELQGLGWDEGFAAGFQPFAAEGFVPGRVTLEHQHIYTIHTGQSDLLATVAGSLRHRIVS